MLNYAPFFPFSQEEKVMPLLWPICCVNLNIVKNFAKLAVFFSLTFIIIFLAAAGIRFLSLRVDWAKSLPPKPETSLTLLIAAAHWALSLALFSAILLALSYAARRNCFAPFTMIIIMVLSMAFSFGLSFALENWKSVPFAQSAGIPLGGKGLILSNSLNGNETAVILLNGATESLGPRVTAIPDQPLIFNEAATANLESQSGLRGESSSIILPPVPFADVTPWFLKSLYIDIRLNAEMFHKKFIEGLMPFLIYSFSLIFFLCSLGFAVKFSVWPLANLFLGVLVFRGVLALETFFYTPEMQDIFDSFFKNLMSVETAVPFIFIGFGLMVHFYSFLVFIIQRRDRDD